MSSYREVVKQLAGDDRMACRWCNKLTLVETLNQYGARCFECYEAYCHEVPGGSVPTTRSEKFALLGQIRQVIAQPTRDPKQWAYDLQQRELRGDRLTPAQRDAWRAAARWVKDESDGRGESLEHADRARQRLGITERSER
jgi:hypothetical protein